MEREVRFVIGSWEIQALGDESAEEFYANPGMAVTKVANIICK